MSFKHIITTANSIIGVSILAMPFCFKQCGILLAMLMILISGLVVKFTSYLLLKSANYAKGVRSYELLAQYAFGPAGKLAIEICMIGFMMGTCIAFFVVIGDLAPPIIANVIGMPPSANLRLWIMVGVGAIIVTPLSLLRNIDSLSAICTLSISYYFGVTIYIMFSARENLLKSQWSDLINWWRPKGIWSSLPIFTMALSCQAQVFEVYNDLPDPSIAKMNQIVRGAVNLCSSVYCFVGIFGYIALYEVDFAGNILIAYPSTVLVEAIKIAFTISVALSFPLVIFPCRTSIHSLLFKSTGYKDSIGANYIPPNRFNTITVVVVVITLIVGIMIPDIEFVLGIVGSTIGNAVCILLPSVIFVHLTTVNTTERIGAQAMFIISIILMSLGTFVHLQGKDNNVSQKNILVPQVPPNIIEPLITQPPDIGGLKPDEPKEINPPSLIGLDKSSDHIKDPNDKNNPGDNVVRIEPVIPIAPVDKEVQDKKDKDVKPDESKQPDDKILKNDHPPDTVKGVEPKEEKTKEEKAEKLIQQLEEQKEEHKQIIEEQKEVLEKMKQHLVAEEEAKKKDDVAVDVDKINNAQAGVPVQNQESIGGILQENVPLVVQNQKVDPEQKAYPNPQIIQEQQNQQAPPVQEQQHVGGQQQQPLLQNQQIHQKVEQQQPLLPNQLVHQGQQQQQPVLVQQNHQQVYQNQQPPLKRQVQQPNINAQLMDNQVQQQQRQQQQVQLNQFQPQQKQQIPSNQFEPQQKQQQKIQLNQFQQQQQVPIPLNNQFQNIQDNRLPAQPNQQKPEVQLQQAQSNLHYHQQPQFNQMQQQEPPKQFHQNLQQLNPVSSQKNLSHKSSVAQQPEPEMQNKDFKRSNSEQEQKVGRDL